MRQREGTDSGTKAHDIQRKDVWDSGGCVARTVDSGKHTIWWNCAGTTSERHREWTRPSSACSFRKKAGRLRPYSVQL